MAYSFDGKQKTLSFGAYPAVSLKDARQKREEAKGQRAKGIDPGEQKKEAKAVAAAAAREQAATFEAVTREWYAKKNGSLSPGHQKKILSRLERQLFPHIGGISFSKLEPTDILAASVMPKSAASLKRRTASHSLPDKFAAMRGL